MSKERAAKGPSFVLPKDALKKVILGQSFAEYDLIRKEPDLFVETAGIRAVQDPSSSKSIFVGRRGTGKTAVTYYLQNREPKTTVVLIPQIFSIVNRLIGSDQSGKVQQRPFKTLVNCIKRSLLDEVIACWVQNGAFSYRENQQSEVTRSRGEIEDLTFDTRVLDLLKSSWPFLDEGREKDWNRFDGRLQKLQGEVESEGGTPKRQVKILIDRIDEDWDGSDSAVTLLMALLHACVQLNAVLPNVRCLTFIRENMFDRVRQADSEFSRIETSVVSLEWSKEQLRELIERRLRRSLITKPALNGPTWKAFFQDAPEKSSEDVVFGYCQYRPREVLTYCSFALENAQGRNQTHITVDDLQAARTRFSESRLKELSDEYAENYPGVGKVVASFFGLGKRFTYKAIDDFVKKILVNKSLVGEASKWIYRYTSPESFMSLLYGIGFGGIRDPRGLVHFRLHETQPLTPSDITSDSVLVIHETYTDALQLQDKLVPSIAEAYDLRTEGLIVDLPESFNPEEYKKKLEELQLQLTTLTKGKERASEFEEFTGELIRLCFYRSLSNFQAKPRTIGNTTIKDWVAGNHATGGFWQMVRDRYKATQIVFECKNYDALAADDFHQASYYMNDTSGRFVMILARIGRELERKHYEHIRSIVQANNGNAMLLILGERDIQVLLRQALNGKNNEPHLQGIFDTTVRKVSSS